MLRYLYLKQESIYYFGSRCFSERHGQSLGQQAILRHSQVSRLRMNESVTRLSPHCPTQRSPLHEDRDVSAAVTSCFQPLEQLWRVKGRHCLWSKLKLNEHCFRKPKGGLSGYISTVQLPAFITTYELKGEDIKFKILRNTKLCKLYKLYKSQVLYESSFTCSDFREALNKSKNS